jgi:DNA-binding NtrC family response regulator
VIDLSRRASVDTDVDLTPWVLVVAAERSHQEQLERDLTKAGFSVELARCASTAIASLAVITPAFIVVDPALAVEDRNRLELHLKRRRLLPTIPIQTAEILCGKIDSSRISPPEQPAR